MFALEYCCLPLVIILPTAQQGSQSQINAGHWTLDIGQGATSIIWSPHCLILNWSHSQVYGWYDLYCCKLTLTIYVAIAKIWAITLLFKDMLTGFGGPWSASQSSLTMVVVSPKLHHVDIFSQSLLAAQSSTEQMLTAVDNQYSASPALPPL